MQVRMRFTFNSIYTSLSPSSTTLLYFQDAHALYHLFITLLVCLLLSSFLPMTHAQSSSPSSFTLGSLLPFSSSNPKTRSQAHSFWEGMQLAQRDLNRDLRQQGFQVHLHNFDYTNTSVAVQGLPTSYTVLNGTLQLLQRPVHGIVAPGDPDFHRGVADVVNVFKVPMCNHGTGEPYYFNKKEYPYIFNTIPSLKHYASGFMQLLRKFDWTRFLVLYSKDDFGIALSSDLKAHTIAQPSLDAKLIGFETDDASLTSSLALALKTPYRVYFVAAKGDARAAFLRVLVTRSRWAHANVTWVFAEDLQDTLRSFPMFKTHQTAWHRALRGVFTVHTQTTLAELPSFTAFQKAVTPSADAHVALNGYVCTVVLVRGLLSTASNVLQWNLARMVNEGLVKVRVGSGDVVQLDGQGSLRVRTAVYNWQTNGPALIGTLDGSSGTWREPGQRQVMFLHGASTPPSDVPELDDLYIYLHSVSGLSVTIIAAILAAFCLLAILIFLVAFKHPVVTPSKPLYIIWMLVGSLLFLSCVVAQFFLASEFGCNLSLLLGVLGAANTIGPLIAKSCWIVQLHHPSLLAPSAINVAELSSSSSSSPSSPSSSTFRSSTNTSSWISKPTQLALAVILIDLLITTLYIGVTPLRGTRVTIGAHSQTYICVSESMAVSTNPLFAVLVVYHTLLMVWVMWMSWASSGSKPVAPTPPLSMRMVSIMAYQYSLVGVLIFLTWALDAYLYPISYWVRIASLFLTVTLHAFLMVLPTLFTLYKHVRPGRHPQISVFSLPASMFEVPLTSTPMLSSVAAHEYEGTLMCMVARTSWWQGPSSPAWQRRQVRVLPQSQWFFLLPSHPGQEGGGAGDVGVGMKYTQVVYAPTPTHPHVARIFPRRASMAMYPTSKHLFYVFTKRNVYVFWARSEEAVKTWAEIFKSGVVSAKTQLN